MSFESKPSNPEIAQETIFRNERETEVMTQAYEKAVAILDSQSIKPEMFADTYSEKLLADCARYVSACERKFEENRESSLAWKRAEIFGKTLEALLHDQINQGVYGEGVRGVSTAAYDDYYSGVDEVIERFDSNGSTYIGCALDFTFGSPNKKMEAIQKSIQAGVLENVIFYESPFGEPAHIHGKLQGLPKMVVGMDAEHLVEIASQWLENDTEALKNNQLFLLLLRQIEQQSEVYEVIAKRAHRTEVAARYKQINNTISSLYKELKDERGITMLDSSVLGDKVSQSIKNQLSEMLG